jgi:hypothetical protein
MTARAPLVLVDGRTSELPAADHVRVAGSTPPTAPGNGVASIGAGIVTAANAGDVQVRIGNGADLDLYGYDIGRQGATSDATIGFLRFVGRQVGFGGYTFQNAGGELLRINNAGVCTFYGSAPSGPASTEVKIGGGQIVAGGSGAFVNVNIYGSANPYIVFDDGTGPGYIEALTGHFVFTPRSGKWAVFAGSTPTVAGAGEVKIGGGAVRAFSFFEVSSTGAVNFGPAGDGGYITGATAGSLDLHPATSAVIYGTDPTASGSGQVRIGGGAIYTAGNISAGLTSGVHSITINGGDAGADGEGSYLAIANGITAVAYLGNNSAVLGGGYNGDTLLYCNDSFQLKTGDVSYYALTVNVLGEATFESVCDTPVIGENTVVLGNGRAYVWDRVLFYDGRLDGGPMGMEIMPENGDPSYTLGDGGLPHVWLYGKNHSSYPGQIDVGGYGCTAVNLHTDDGYLTITDTAVTITAGGGGSSPGTPSNNTVKVRSGSIAASGWLAGFGVAFQEYPTSPNTTVGFDADNGRGEIYAWGPDSSTWAGLAIGVAKDGGQEIVIEILPARHVAVYGVAPSDPSSTEIFMGGGQIRAGGAGAFANVRLFGSANPYIIFDDGTGPGYIEALTGHFVFTPRSGKWSVFAGSSPSASGSGEAKVGGGVIDTYSNYRIAGTQVVAARRTGWAAATGTATRTTFATGSVTTAQLAERVKALIDDLTTHGLIGA